MRLTAKFLSFIALFSQFPLLADTQASHAFDQATQLPKVTERYRALETYAKALTLLETMYVDEELVKTDLLVEKSLIGMVQGLDPHTMVLTKKNFDKMSSDTKGQFGGIGVVVSNKNNRVIVEYAIDGTPAKKAGVIAGDEIVEIDGVSVKSIGFQAAIDKMQGSAGTTIRFLVKRVDHSKSISFKIKREVIRTPSVKGNLLDPQILYTKISSFQENTADDLEKIIKPQQDQLKGLILDLRDNPGGLFNQSVKVADLFIESGLIVSTVGRNKDHIEREFASKSQTIAKLPMIVLVNAGSASASEIVAGALQDHKRALILGEDSFGKGSVQSLVRMPSGLGFKFTVGRYYTPNDRSIQAKGISPDIMISSKSLSKKVKKNPVRKREADLQGHIESEDLSDYGKNTGLLSTVEQWNKLQKNDRQLKVAYAYLRGWSLFKNRSVSSRQLSKL